MLTKTLIAMLVVASTTVGIASTASAAPMRETTTKVEARREPVREAPRPVVHETVRETVRQPVVRETVIEHKVDRPVIVRDEHRYDHHDPFIAPRYVVAPPIVVAPFASGQMFFQLGSAPGARIELASTGGATYVQQVSIQYADGTSQLVTVDREIDARTPTLDLGTDGCAVSGVTVFGQGAALAVNAV